ncbi:MAG: hypothetical protein K2Y56_24030 [Methylobacterium sp.]|uniref:hypothetical protein n=1 Tax=Methylobacterium sp. TaxID=409 RepID=UPI0025F8E3DC|nr:hypothetical protein [Methylobacterium sp.]MBX9934547.1 hypothetical protein [Methylobacterium sp.]
MTHRFDLVVKSPFASYAVGQRITDPEVVKAILTDGRSASVVKVAAEKKAPVKAAKAD